MAVGIVGTPVLGVGKDLVGLRELLEAFFGPAIPGVGIRVVIAGEAAVGLLDLRLRRLLGDAQNLVIVALSRQI